MLLLLLLIQTDAWSVTPPTGTVGDTIVIERLIPLEGVEARARVAPLDASASIQPLGPPRIVYESAGIRVQLVVAGFAPESVRIEMPDIDLIHGDGTVETIGGGTATVFIASVLPAASDTTPDPRPSQAPIGRVNTSLQFPIVLPLSVILVGLMWAGWRRRKRPRPRWDPGGAEVVEPPVGRWIQAGEPRAVAALAMVRLRERLADLAPDTTAAMSVPELIDTLRESHPDWPVSELSDALTSLERASFAPAVAADVMGIVDTAEECLHDLERAAEPEPSSSTA